MRARAHLLGPTGLLPAAKEAIERFAFTPARAEPLAALRIGLALVLLGQAALIAPSWSELYTRSGVVPDGFEMPGVPTLGGLTRLLAPTGLGETAIFAAVAGGYVLSLVALLLGLGTRIAAALCWVLHLMLLTTGDGTSYGADYLAHIFLFYLLWFPSGAALSLDRRLRRVPSGPSSSARFALRVVQVHLCIIYLTSGASKALSPAWWSGSAIWRAVMMPEYRQLDFSWLASHSWLAVVAGWAVLFVEISYAALIWPRATRRLWVLATTGLHLGIAVFMGLTVFGAVMIVFTVAAFGVSAEPRERGSAGLHRISRGNPRARPHLSGTPRSD